jgi:hypothetical protein
MSHLTVQIVPVLSALVRAIEDDPNPLDSPAFARAKKLLLNKGQIEYTSEFIEAIARMRLYQRQFFAAKHGSELKKAALGNAIAAEAYVDSCLHQMGYVPGKRPDPAQPTNLFEADENPFHPDYEGG